MRKQRLAVFFSVVQILFIVLLVVLVGASFGTKIPFFAKLGINFFTVTSGSMEPAIPTGSLIYVGKYKLDELKQGDIITYSLANDAGQAVVTHRIEEVKKVEETREVGEEEKKIVEYEIRTKGDANDEVDNYILGPNNVIGIYRWHVPYVGYLTSFVQSTTGFISLIIIPGIILIVWELVSLIMHFKNQRDGKKDEEIAMLKAELARKEEK